MESSPSRAGTVSWPLREPPPGESWSPCTRPGTTRCLGRVDAAAKTFVGPRHSSVFATPPIEVFRQDGYAEACGRCRALTGRAPSKQAWQLGPKILHVDSVAARDLRLIEVHPEVSFCALLGRHVTHGKKSWAGHVVRRATLARAGVVLPDDSGPAGVAAPDDVLDAAVAAWSAHRHANGISQHLEPVLTGASGRTIAIRF